MDKAISWFILFVRNMFHALAGQPTSCRFDPVCSCYTRESLKRHGAFKGLLISLRRISKCRPGGGFGYDPVP